MNIRWTVASAITVLLVAHSAVAQPGERQLSEFALEALPSAEACTADAAPTGAERVWQIRWLDASGPERSARTGSLALDLSAGSLRVATLSQEPTTRRPVASDYGRGSEIRLKVHKYASIATIPLFVAETWLGQSLYNGTDNSESKRGAHAAVAASIGVLFGVNSVTGIWNLAESRKNPSGRTRRTVHGILMLAADAGFVATGLLAPDSEGGEDGPAGASPAGTGKASTHRAVALSSMGVALASYLMMLIWRD